VARQRGPPPLGAARSEPHLAARAKYAMPSNILQAPSHGVAAGTPRMRTRELSLAQEIEVRLNPFAVAVND
jgi:hypothetical protein